NVLRQWAPEVHRRLWPHAWEPGFAECVDGRVATALKLSDVRRYPVHTLVERRCGGRLNCHESSGIDKRLDLRHGANELGLSTGPAATPSGHVVCLGHRMELNRNVA